MINHKFIHHYATTFLRIAQEKEAVLKYQNQLQNFAQLLEGNLYLKESLLDPIETLEHKKAILKQVLDKQKYDTMVTNLIMVILDHHHEKYFQKSSRIFKTW